MDDDDDIYPPDPDEYQRWGFPHEPNEWQRMGYEDEPDEWQRMGWEHEPNEWQMRGYEYDPDEWLERLLDEWRTSPIDVALHFPGDQLDPDLKVNLDYLSKADVGLLTYNRTLIVKSPIGTGKTRFAARFIEAVEHEQRRSLRVLVVTHRRALAADLAKRLNDDLLTGKFECYLGLSAAELQGCGRLVICINSLWKLAQIGAELPEYDLILVDEIEQVLAHLNGQTLEPGGQAVRAYRLFSHFTRTAERIVVMDADAGPICRNWLNELRQTPFALVNTYVPDRGPLYLYATEDKLIAAARELIAQNAGPIVFATNTRKKAKDLKKLFINQLGEANVFMICGENSTDQDAVDFISNINRALPELKVFIYSPSLGTGVDITCDVRAGSGISAQRRWRHRTCVRWWAAVRNPPKLTCV